MKPIQLYSLIALICISLAGCTSTETPQASAQLKDQFKGAPMPPDAQKKFQESMKKNKELMQQKAGGKP